MCGPRRSLSISLSSLQILSYSRRRWPGSGGKQTFLSEFEISLVWPVRAVLPITLYMDIEEEVRGNGNRSNVGRESGRWTSERSPGRDLKFPIGQHDRRKHTVSLLKCGFNSSTRLGNSLTGPTSFVSVHTTFSITTVVVTKGNSNVFTSPSFAHHFEPETLNSPTSRPTPHLLRCH